MYSYFLPNVNTHGLTKQNSLNSMSGREGGGGRVTKAKRGIFFPGQIVMKAFRGNERDEMLKIQAVRTFRKIKVHTN